MVPVAERRSGNSHRGWAMVRFSPAWLKAAIAAAGLLSGCASGAPPSPPAPSGRHAAARAPRRARAESLGVIDEGWHTGLVLSAKALGPGLADLRHRFPNAQYLVFGWGNRRFYEAASPGAEWAIAALFPSPSVIFVQEIRGHKPLKPSPGTDLRWLCISSSGMRRLDGFLEMYFRKDRQGSLVRAEPGSPNGEFYASTGTYDALHTCNTWTAEALQVGGLPVHSAGILFANQVMSEIRPLRPCTPYRPLGGNPVPRAVPTIR